MSDTGIVVVRHLLNTGLTSFALTPPSSAGGNWTYAMLKDFGGNHPDQPLILRGSKLYGAIATAQGGAAFELQPPAISGVAWTATFHHNFTNAQAPGAAIVGGALVMDKSGVIYGATQDVNAQPPNGTVYRIATK